MSSILTLKWLCDLPNSCINISSAISVSVRFEFWELRTRGLTRRCPELALCCCWIRSWFYFLSCSNSAFSFCFSAISYRMFYWFTCCCWMNLAFSALKFFTYSANIIFYFCMNSWSFLNLHCNCSSYSYFVLISSWLFSFSFIYSMIIDCLNSSSCYSANILSYSLLCSSALASICSLSVIYSSSLAKTSSKSG